jgi:hypothetical protein
MPSAQAHRPARRIVAVVLVLVLVVCGGALGYRRLRQSRLHAQALAELHRLKLPSTWIIYLDDVEEEPSLDGIAYFSITRSFHDLRDSGDTVTAAAAEAAAAAGWTTAHWDYTNSRPDCKDSCWVKGPFYLTFDPGEVYASESTCEGLGTATCTSPEFEIGFN